MDSKEDRKNFSLGRESCCFRLSEYDKHVAGREIAGGYQRGTVKSKGPQSCTNISPRKNFNTVAIQFVLDPRLNKTASSSDKRNAGGPILSMLLPNNAGKRCSMKRTMAIGRSLALPARTDSDSPPLCAEKERFCHPPRRQGVNRGDHG